MSDEKIFETADIQQQLELLPEWSYTDGHLTRTYQAQGWKGAIMLTNLIAHYAEVAWHHPDLAVSWGKVAVRLRTHSADGITAKDFELAHKLERAVMWRPDERSALEGTPSDATWAYIKS